MKSTKPESEQRLSVYCPPCAVVADGWQICAGLSIQEAERLLDWLEANGATRRETSVDETGVTVRWQR